MAITHSYMLVNTLVLKQARAWFLEIPLSANVHMRLSVCVCVRVCVCACAHALNHK